MRKGSGGNGSITACDYTVFIGKSDVFTRKHTGFFYFAGLATGPLTPGLTISRILTREGAAVPGEKPRRDLTPPPGWPASVVVHRRLIFAPCLLVMAALAKGTPVAPVPEQSLIPSVCDDVINDRGLGVLAALHALLAERVRLQEQSAGLLPCPVIASAGSRPYFLRMQWPVQITVLGAGWDQRSAAGVLAGHLWFGRHQRTRPHSANCSKPPSWLM